MRRHMVIELLSPAKKDCLRQLNRTVLPQGNSIILRAAIAETSANRFVGRGDRRDDILLAEILRKSNLDAGASRFCGLQKDESVLMRDDHGRIRGMVVLQAAAEIG